MVPIAVTLPASLLMSINLSSLPLSIVPTSPAISDSHLAIAATNLLRVEPSSVGDLSSHVRQSIEHGRESGELSTRQAHDFLRQADAISTLETRYSDGGYSDSEAMEIRSRLEALGSLVYAAAAPGSPAP
jgi:hypothetical protein